MKNEGKFLCRHGVFFEVSHPIECPSLGPPLEADWSLAWLMPVLDLQLKCLVTDFSIWARSNDWVACKPKCGDGADADYGYDYSGLITVLEVTGTMNGYNNIWASAMLAHFFRVRLLALEARWTTLQHVLTKGHIWS